MGDGTIYRPPESNDENDKWCCTLGPVRHEEGAYLNRYVTRHRPAREPP
jgi:hypothetical protein